MAIYPERGNSAGERASIAGTAAYANPSPATAPSVLKTPLSTRSCRTSRARDAPIGGGRLRCGAGRQTPHDAIVEAENRRHGVAIELDGQIQRGILTEENELRRHHADHLRHDPVEPDGAADNSLFGTEAPRPVTVREDDGERRTRVGVLLGKLATEGRLRP